MEEDTLVFDLESSPMKVATWGMFEQNATHVYEYSHLLTISYNWFNEKTVHVKTLADFKTFKKDFKDDRELVLFVHGLFSRAKRIIAHHGKAFDIKYMNTRFMKHGLLPPSPYQIIDTKIEAKRIGLFPSNSLKWLLDYKGGHAQKLDTDGIPLWIKCSEQGDLKALKKMGAYNKGDIIGLKALYVWLKPWMPNIPSPDRLKIQCPELGCKSWSTKKFGKEFRANGWKQGYQCTCCGRRFTGEELHPYKKNETSNRVRSS